MGAGEPIGPSGGIFATHSLEAEYPGYVPEVALVPEPYSLGVPEFDKLLNHAVRVGASEINLQTGQPAYLMIEGRLCRVTMQATSQAAMEMICNHVYGTNGVSVLNSGEPLNKDYQLEIADGSEPGSRIRRKSNYFRFNAAPCLAEGISNAIQITIRTIPTEPPSLASLNLEPEILANLYPEAGIVMVIGPTGSGKTTLLASVVDSILLDPNSHKKIAMFESPPEFIFHNRPRAAALLSQHDIPGSYKTYAQGIKDTLRRMTRVSVIGECRERDTIQAAVEVSKTGQMAYTTGHSHSIDVAIGRFADLFEPHERMTKLFEIVGQMRLAIVQKLVPRIDTGRRLALREYLVFDQDVRDAIRAASTQVEAEAVIKHLVETRGQSMLMSATRAFEAGLIAESELLKIESEGAGKGSLTERLGLGS